jgi:hypothetical protein
VGQSQRTTWQIHLDYWTSENTDPSSKTYAVVPILRRYPDWHKMLRFTIEKSSDGYTLPLSLTAHVAYIKCSRNFSGQDIWEMTKMWFPYYDLKSNQASFQYPSSVHSRWEVNITFLIFLDGNYEIII